MDGQAGADTQSGAHPYSPAQPATGDIPHGGAALEAVVSITTGDFRSKITVQTLIDKKQKHEPITCLTAYDYGTARLVDEADIDIILVGDSLAQVVLGYDNTLPVTVDEMLHHTRAVRRAVKRAFLVADMPYASYHVGIRKGVENAARFVKEGGAEAVKIEGGAKRVPLIEKMQEAEIPVVGHIGLTPQSVNVMGGYKVQGKTLGAIEQLMQDAVALDRAGVAFLVLEGIPREVASMITDEVETPTIGIGAGPDCDGQVLVIHDLIGMTFHPAAKFVRKYAEVGSEITSAVKAFRDDVKNRAYPNDAESYHLPKETQSSLDAISERKRALRK
jgi:3-methyl-2-oxobutanoate hydroxymethyltransferase